ncbi:MAG: hypothetical protein K5641_03505 [Lachnospiraceae bacterium]|nr:hypothetical protein [Lachnospiraceae bacterium]
MNMLFHDLADNPTKSLEEVFDTRVYNIFPEREAAMHTFQQVLHDINNGTPNAVDFVYALTKASLDGAGSVIASGGLNASAENVLGDSETSSKIHVDRINIEKGSGSTIPIQAGADSDSDNRIVMKLFRMSSKDLGLDRLESIQLTSSGDVAVNALTEEEATSGINIFKNAIALVSGVRSYYGAMQNRLEHTIANLDNVVENTTAAESRIRDTDMAEEMVRFSKESILQQAGQSMLAQANQSTQGILALLK